MVANLAIGSGSNTVFRKIHSYSVSTDLSVLESVKPDVADYLQSLDRQIFIVEISERAWLETAELLLADYNVTLQLGRNEPIDLYLDQQLGLVVGGTRRGNLVILIPYENRCHSYDGT
jgi:hypothetical protein